jgi:zinc transport system permease protein
MLEIFQYDFMVRAFIAGTVAAVVAPAIGIFLVTRRYSFMADALSHVSLAGVAIGYLTHTQPIAIAIITTVTAALCVEELRSRKKVLGESALALFLSGGLALSAVLLGLTKNAGPSVSGILFGSITTVSTEDIWYICILGVLVLSLIALLYRQLVSISIDEELAKASGLHVVAVNRIIVILAALTVALTMRIVGVLLVGALMVIPVLSAMQFRLSFLSTFFLSIAFSLAAVIAGLFTSYFVGTASGGTIVLIALGLFLLSTVAGKRV